MWTWTDLHEDFLKEEWDILAVESVVQYSISHEKREGVCHSSWGRSTTWCIGIIRTTFPVPVSDSLGWPAYWCFLHCKKRLSKLSLPVGAGFRRLEETGRQATCFKWTTVCHRDEYFLKAYKIKSVLSVCITFQNHRWLPECRNNHFVEGFRKDLKN